MKFKMMSFLGAITVLTAVVIAISHIFPHFVSPKEKDVTPLLDTGVLPGFYLRYSTEEVVGWDEFEAYSPNDYKKKGFNVNEVKSNKVIRFDEFWGSIRKEEWEKKWGRNKPKGKKVPKPDYTTVSLERTYFKSGEAAKIWVKMGLQKHPLDEGSFSGIKIGDACWSYAKVINGSKNHPMSSKLLVFVKNNVLVEIRVTRPMGRVDIEKIALIVESRL